ncbi:MMPL family transporter [Actinospica durhamensis]|uniref:MMPL family transporter n=1 Tax=Actinospica durhamensis TaxID=1508375 RepID=A0A941ETF1_9ACTN|nr:MMPL family transporter [Actinospica durhamensis]MBR7836107.1 MMPL family transporter [Actinospica durhamensis]
MTALALWCTRHRLLVVVTWALLLLGLGAATVAKGSAYNSSFALSGTDSTQAQQLLDSAFPGQQGDTVSLVWHVESGTVHASSVQSSVDHVLAEYKSSGEVQSVQSPYSAGGSGQISADGKTAYASIDLDDATSGLSSGEANQLIGIAHSASHGGLEVELGGSAVSGALQTPAEDSEIVGMAAAAIVLFLAFGSLFSMLLPILTAAAGVGGGLLTVGLLSHVLNVAGFAPTLGALVGLGVGIDYALFIVTRHRRGLTDGMPIDTSIGQSVTTSGRAVLFAGGTVCVALLGMLVLGIGFLDGVAVATALTVAVTVLAALTLLPALLSFLGPRALSRRQRRRQGASALSRVRAARLAAISVPRGLWDRWADIVHRRPRALSLVALGLMLVLAIPTLTLRLGSADASTDPVGSTTHKAYEMLADGFGPGFDGSLTVAVQASNAQQQSQVGHLLTAISHTPGVASATEQASVAQSGGRTIDVLNVVPTTSPQSSATTDLLANLREHVIPAATSGTGLQAHVGGLVATNADFASVLSSKLPLFIAVIVGLSFLLLLLAFRSLLIPLTAAVMNLLAAAAAFGVVTAFFQWGWGSSALGMGGSGPVEAFLPVMLIAILFGLSMDYQVFLVSRMHEEWRRAGCTTRAVKLGQVETSRVITAAATIMVCVFCSFAVGSQRVIGEFGIGLAAAVLLDAFVLRTVLVPAAMHLFGRWNWWLPRWLDRPLPRLTVEPSPAEGLPIIPEPLPTPVFHGAHRPVIPGFPKLPLPTLPRPATAPVPAGEAKLPG